MYVINNIYAIKKDGRCWTLYDFSEGKLGAVLANGSRAKIQKATAVHAGMLPIFWYEVITCLKMDTMRVTPVQASKIWRMTVKQMADLNQRLDGGTTTKKWLDYLIDRCTK